MRKYISRPTNVIEWRAMIVKIKNVRCEIRIKFCERVMMKEGGGTGTEEGQNDVVIFVIHTVYLYKIKILLWCKQRNHHSSYQACMINNKYTF